MRVFTSQFALLLVVLIQQVPAGPPVSRTQVPEIFWEQEILRALDERDGFCRLLALEPARELYGLTDPVIRERAGSRLSEIDGSGQNPWHHFFSAILVDAPHADPALRPYIDAFLKQALVTCGNDPGRLWLYISESRRFGYTAWVEKGLEQLERVFLSGGAQAVPLVSHQLLYFGVQHETAGEIESARAFYDWALRFDRHLVWAPLRKSLAGLPRSIAFPGPGAAETAHVLRNSWIVQISLARNLLRWSGATVSAAALGIFLYLILTYGSLAVHPLTHLLPSGLSEKFRSRCAWCISLSLMFFGLIPFLWLVAFALRPHLSRRDKILTGICSVLLTIAPLAAGIDDMLASPLRPGNSLSLFREILDGGYTPQREGIVDAWIARDSTSYLAYAGAANLLLKKGDADRALSLIKRAEKLNPDDPVIKLTAGNIHYYAGNYEKAGAYYSTCLQQHPGLEATYFNPCLLYFGEMKFMEGMRLMERASRLNPVMISTFLQKNDQLFGGDWPRIRHFLLPDYKGMYFWKTVLPRFGGSWRSANELWAGAWLGLPVSWSVVLGFILMFGLPFMGSTAGMKNVRCALCGQAICRSCVKGGRCRECHEYTGSIAASSMGPQLEARIIRHRIVRTRVLIPAVLDALFPGLGPLARSEKIPLSLALFALSCGVYGIYVLVYGFDSGVPSWATARILFPLLAAAVVYSTVFLIRAVWGAARSYSREVK